ncbi:hypothetical protein [Mycolicibacterium sp.]|uniref:hypothetical protein n=1 Tax=Mycolicibacterium sp. TaxID=2320850 RepID=UPI0037C65A79
MSGTGLEAAAATFAQSQLSPPPSPAPTSAQLSSPVAVGPVAVSSLGGIPFIGIRGPIHQYSGKRMAAMVIRALTEAGLTIEIPDGAGG